MSFDCDIAVIHDLFIRTIRIVIFKNYRALRVNNSKVRIIVFFNFVIL